MFYGLGLGFRFRVQGYTHQMLSELQRVHRCGDMPLQAGIVP